MRKTVACGPAVNLIFISDFPHTRSRGKGTQVRRGHEIDSYSLLLLCWRNSAPELHREGRECRHAGAMKLTRIVCSYYAGAIQLLNYTEREEDAGTQGP